MIEELTLRIDLIQNSIRVALMTSGKDNYFPMFFHLFEERDSVGSDIEPYLKGVAIDVDSQLDVWSGFILFEAVDESLI